MVNVNAPQMSIDSSRYFSTVLNSSKATYKSSVKTQKKQTSNIINESLQKKVNFSNDTDLEMNAKSSVKKISKKKGKTVKIDLNDYDIEEIAYSKNKRTSSIPKRK